ncbi:MAG: tRNA lysidine(34) synthetase TilS [Oscillospiraceae bacterium]|nr:tRNA lysidine(34) synthetase TilS [Oscillospiraceae bacterium]
MLTKISENIKQNNLIEPGERVLCAFSGGVDSSVMLDMMVKLSGELGITVCAAHLNHMLRGKDADRDEEFARRRCEEYGIEFISGRRDVAAYAKEKGESTELAARNVRYDFLESAARTLFATKIATAHNANDNLETILMNLARGTGIDGLCGIPHRRGNIIRPILSLSREEIEKYAEENNIEYCLDKTNEDTAYSRNRLRRDAIPALIATNPAAVENAYRASRHLRHTAYISKRAAYFRAKDLELPENACQREGLSDTSPALMAEVCEYFAKNAMEDVRYSLSSRHIDAIAELAKSNRASGEVSLPHGLICRCEYDRIVFEKRGEVHKPSEKKLSIGENFWGTYRIIITKFEENGKINNSFNTFLVPCDKIESGLTVRSRMTGDSIKLSKRPGKTLKKLFVDEKIPKGERDTLPVFSDGENVLFVYGFGADEENCRIDDLENTLKIEIIRI